MSDTEGITTEIMMSTQAHESRRPSGMGTLPYPIGPEGHLPSIPPGTLYQRLDTLQVNLTTHVKRIVYGLR
jgi:hypothetical protein